MYHYDFYLFWSSTSRVTSTVYPVFSRASTIDMALSTFICRENWAKNVFVHVRTICEMELESCDDCIVASCWHAVQDNFFPDTVKHSLGNSFTLCSGVTILVSCARLGAFIRLLSWRRFWATRHLHESLDFIGTLKTYSIDLLSCLETNYQNPARRTIGTELTTTKESKDIYVCRQKVIVT